MVLDKAVEYWEEYGGFDMVLIRYNNEIYYTEELSSSFSALGLSLSQICLKETSYQKLKNFLNFFGYADDRAKIYHG